MTAEQAAVASRPTHAQALHDAREHLTRSAAAIRAAMALEPTLATDLGDVLAGVLDHIEALQRAATINRKD